MSSLLYSFRFDQLYFEIPYIGQIVDIRTPWSQLLSIGSCLIYLVLITMIFPFFRTRWHETIAKIHHSFLFIYSLVIFCSSLYYIIEKDEISNWSKFMCTPVSDWLRALSISFTISKIWEWGDTAMLIWKGHSLKKIGFLHIYHHATTFLLFLLVTNFPGTEKAGMLLNGFVHTLMYCHFAYRLPKFFRPLITGLQILQLLTVTYMWWDISRTCSVYADYPSQQFWEYLTPYAFVPVYCLFFFKFFIEQYLLSSSKSTRSSSKKIS